MFFKVRKWYQIAQRITFGATELKSELKMEEECRNINSLYLINTQYPFI